MEPNVLNDYKIIAAAIESRGFPATLRNPIYENLERGIKSFEIDFPEPFLFDKDVMQIKVHIGPLPSNPDRTVLIGMTGILNQDIKIPQKEIELMDYRFSTGELEDKLRNAPSPELLKTISREDFDALIKKYTDAISIDMQILKEQHPDIFNRLGAKYNPTLNFVVEPELLSQQASIVADHIHIGNFPNYYNVTLRDAYNLMSSRAMMKQLYTKKPQVSKPGGKPSHNFNTWLNLDGNGNIQFLQTRKGLNVDKTLQEYNFLETNKDFARKSIADLLSKGNLVDLTNANNREDKVKVAADPGYYMLLKLYDRNGYEVKDHSPYLKTALRITESDVISAELVDNTKSARQSSGIQMPTTNATSTDTQFTTGAAKDNKNKQGETPSESSKSELPDGAAGPEPPPDGKSKGTSPDQPPVGQAASGSLDAGKASNEKITRKQARGERNVQPAQKKTGMSR